MALDDLRRRGRGIGGEERDAEAGGRLAADQDNGDRAGAEDSFAITGTATGLLITGSRTMTARTTQLFP